MWVNNIVYIKITSCQRKQSEGSGFLILPIFTYKVGMSYKKVKIQVELCGTETGTPGGQDAL